MELQTNAQSPSKNEVFSKSIKNYKNPDISNFCRSALFHMKSKNYLKYVVDDSTKHIVFVSAEKCRFEVKV